MPKVILTIGHDSFLLPSDKGVPSILTALSKSIKLERDYKLNGSEYFNTFIVGEPPEVSMQAVTSKMKFRHPEPETGGARTPKEQLALNEKIFRLNP